MTEGSDMNALPSELENDVDIAYAVTHPRLCGSGGLNLFSDLLKAADSNDYFVVAGCGPENQRHFLGHVAEDVHFPEERLIGVNIRGLNSAEARSAILETIGSLLARRGELITADAFGG